ncbi:nudC domain-containing protein 3 [Amia ocellicauda]|uniref:nudC domain-containing protein 3 n=1 Tax=Amia ocellicauda TaxID=2972642 RepID=UPI0034642382
MASSGEMTELYDNALLGILQHVGNIQQFLQVYFGFLYRKTDFYRLLQSPEDRMGFPPGVAEKMVLKTFRLFEQMAVQDRSRSALEAEERERLRERRQAPPVVVEVIVKSEPEKEVLVQPKEEPVQTTPTKQEQTSPPCVEAACADANIPADGAHTEPSADPSNPDKVQEQFQANPDSYNGAVRDNYTWSQDYTDVEVKVHVPSTVRKGKQVSVSLQPGHIRVAVLEGGGERVLMEGALTHKINTETSLWSLEPGRCVLLSLSKSGEFWWSAVLEGEQQIDVNRINRERSMATVDEEEHAVLDRLTFDYHQKLQGLPQSHETKVHNMLKKGWDAEGSPFKGQEFDPAMFNIPPSAVQF